MDQQHYVGLDVSFETTSVCIIDDEGTAVWRGTCASSPDSITSTVQKYAPAASLFTETGCNKSVPLRQAQLRLS